MNEGNVMKKSCCAKGFTLIELSIVMVISGFLFTVIANAYSMKLRDDKQALLMENARELKDALFENLANMGEYPCPANPTLPPTDPMYGVANCLAPFKIITSTVDADMDGNMDEILVGSYPFTTMVQPPPPGFPTIYNSPLTGKHTIDPWGNKFMYIVSRNLTNKATFNDAWGAIKVVDEYGNPLTDTTTTPPKYIHALIMSHGPDGRNAYSQEGTLIDPIPLIACGAPPAPVCPPPPGVGQISVSQLENVNDDDTFLSGLVTDSSTYPNDDYVLFVNNRNSTLWKVVNSNGLPDPQRVWYVENQNAGNIGINTKTPAAKLDVAGNFKADTFESSDVCDTSGGDCMPLTLLAGSNPSSPSNPMGSSGVMECDPGYVMESISNGRVNCVPTFTALPAVSCTAPQVMNGFSNQGNVICITPP